MRNAETLLALVKAIRANPSETDAALAVMQALHESWMEGHAEAAETWRRHSGQIEAAALRAIKEQRPIVALAGRVR